MAGCVTVVDAVELAVEALKGGKVLASLDHAVRLGSAPSAFDAPVLVFDRIGLPTAGVVFAGRRLVDLLEYTKVNADGLSALALVHRLQPKPANLKRPDPILPRITVGAVNPARERGGGRSCMAVFARPPRWALVARNLAARFSIDANALRTALVSELAAERECRLACGPSLNPEGA